MVFEIISFANIYKYWPKFQKLHIFSLSTPWSRTWSRNWAYFCFMGSGFRDTGWFSKLPQSAMKYGHWQRFQKLYIHSLSYPMIRPRGQNWDYFHSMGSGFQVMGQFWAWNLVIGQSSRSCTYNLFLPQGVEIELIFTLCFWDIGRFSELSYMYLGMKLVPDTISFYPNSQTVEIELLSTLRAVASEIQADFQNNHIF